MSKKAKHIKKQVTQTSMHEGCSCLHNKTKLMGIAAGVLLVLFIASLVINPFGSACPDKITGEITSDLSLKEAESIAVSFVNGYLVPEGKASVVETSERHGMYRIMLSFQGQEVESYITKDGEFFFPGTPLNIEDTKLQIEAMNNAAQTDTVNNAAPNNAAPPSEYSKEQMREFNACLAEKGMVVYGAEWCGYCKQLVELLGGYDVIGDLYVECTVETELCAKNDIRGYPTIKLNGNAFTSGRSIEAFSAATGCTLS